MSNPQVIAILPSLHHICAEAEGHLEAHWACIISGPDSCSEDEDSGSNLPSYFWTIADQISVRPADQVPLFQQLR
jgi:hypothetical protein